MKVKYSLPPQEGMDQRGEIITVTSHKMEDCNSEDVKEILDELEGLNCEITVTIGLKPSK